MDVPTFDVEKTWAQRLQLWVDQGNSPYRTANTEKLEACLSDELDGARMVVNLGAASLLRFLRDGRYKNFYDLRAERSIPEMGSDGIDPELARRESVDRLMGFDPDGSKVYFGAVAMESAGVRYYGDWSLVLSGPTGDLKIVDRDSYEFVFQPLADRWDRDALAEGLRGLWRDDLSAMVALKMRDELSEVDRLVTQGRMRNALLRGEEFIEIHREGPFTPDEVHEVRQASVDVASAEQIATAYELGVVPTVEQVVWTSARAGVSRALATASLPTRVVDAESVR